MEVLDRSELKEFEPGTQYLDFSKLRLPLVLRRAEHGDRFMPLGMSHEKKISDFFVDQKLNMLEKEETLLLISDGEIACVVGMRTDERFKVSDPTVKILRVRALKVI